MGKTPKMVLVESRQEIQEAVVPAKYVTAEYPRRFQ